MLKFPLFFGIFLLLSAICLRAAPHFVEVSEDLEVEMNSIVYLQVNATSRFDVAYQWFDEGGLMGYETNATLFFFSGEASTNRYFFAVASDAEGSVTSRTVQVSVIVPPQSTALRILQQPQSIGVRPGQGTALTVEAQSLHPISYQWFKDGLTLASATNHTISITNAQIENGKYDTRYQVRLTDAEGSLMSAIATVTLLENPRIFEQPRTQYIIAGQTLTLGLVASGTPPIGFRWRQRGVTVAHSFSPTYTVTNAQASHSGLYNVVVTNQANYQPGILSPSIRVEVCDDLDQNDLPDCWQTFRGLDPQKSGRNDDADGDGLTNYEEYISGTHPMNNESLLRFDSVEALSTNIVSLSFIAASNTSYTVQMQPSWYAPRWLPLASYYSHPTNREALLKHTNTFSDAIFYRIITPRLD